MSDLIPTCRRIVERHQYETVDGVMIDAMTANAIVTVYDALSDKNRARFDEHFTDPAVAGQVAWKVIGRARKRMEEVS